MLARSLSTWASPVGAASSNGAFAAGAVRRWNSRCGGHRARLLLTAERERLDAELAGIPAAQGKAQALSDEVALWKLLAKALGNDGAIALSIDDAGPALTGIVNDLLLACYGPRFTIAIHTQTALATGEKREGFEIRVHDAESDRDKEFSVMSGGKKVWINECLTRGIALYRAQDSGQSFQTLFTDEADGRLDPECKRAFMRKKREVLPQGGYEREFFISQTLVDEADAVIVMWWRWRLGRASASFLTMPVSRKGAGFFFSGMECLWD